MKPFNALKDVVFVKESISCPTVLQLTNKQQANILVKPIHLTIDCVPIGNKEVAANALVHSSNAETDVNTDLDLTSNLNVASDGFIPISINLCQKTGPATASRLKLTFPISPLPQNKLEHSSNSLNLRIMSSKNDYAWDSHVMGELKQLLIEKITKLKEEDIKPKIKNFVINRFWITISCADSNTADWVRNVLPTIVIWGNKTGCILDEEQEWEAFEGNFCELREHYISIIAHTIKCQNDLNTSNWKLLEKGACTNDRYMLKWYIDATSAAYLRANDYVVYVGVSTVKLEPIDVE